MMRTSPKIGSVALLALFLGVPVRPMRAVQPSKGRLLKLASQSGNFLAGRHAQRNNDFGSAAAFLGGALEKTPDNKLLLQNTFLSRVANGAIEESILIAAKSKSGI